MVSREDVEQILHIIEGDEWLRRKLAKIVVKGIKRSSFMTSDIAEMESKEVKREARSF
jgi:hypothetical protein